MNKHMKIAMTFLTALLCTPLTTVFGQVMEPLGAAICERGERDRDGAPTSCKIAWDFQGTQRAFYWIERFEVSPSDSGWVTQEGPLQGDTRVTEHAAEGGFLYRVVGCKDELRTIDCGGTTAMWAPIIPEDVDDLPDFVTTPDGKYTARSRNFPAEFQIIEYNMALMARLATSVDSNLLPPMTKPPFADLHSVPPGIALWDARMDYNLYMFYPVR